MAVPVTRYAKSGDVHIAYQVFGSGATDLVFAPGFISHVENYWEHPDLARWLLRLGAFARVIMFDKRGTGLSDPVSVVPSLDLRMDDVRAVMDAAGSERAALLGVSEGGALAALFAATHPQRCLQLVLYGAFARFPNAAEALKRFFSYADQAWGSGRSLIDAGAICSVLIMRVCGENSRGTAAARSNRWETDFWPRLTVLRAPFAALGRLSRPSARSKFKSGADCILARSRWPVVMWRASQSTLLRAYPRLPGQARY